MASRRFFVVLTAALLASAACGGSSSQREALNAQSQNVVRRPGQHGCRRQRLFVR